MQLFLARVLVLRLLGSRTGCSRVSLDSLFLPVVGHLGYLLLLYVLGLWERRKALLLLLIPLANNPGPLIVLRELELLHYVL